MVKPIHVRNEVQNPVRVENTFQVLGQEDVGMDEPVGNAVDSTSQGEDVDAGGGKPPDPHGQDVVLECQGVKQGS